MMASRRGLKLLCSGKRLRREQGFLLIEGDFPDGSLQFRFRNFFPFDEFFPSILHPTRATRSIRISRCRLPLKDEPPEYLSRRNWHRSHGDRKIVAFMEMRR